MRVDRIHTPAFLVLSLINFFVMLVFYLLIVIIGFYAIETFGASLSEAGLVAGIFIIGVLLGRLAVGPFIDSISGKVALLSSLALFCVATGLYLTEVNTEALIVLRVFNGIALGVAATIIGTMATRIIPVARRAEGIGYFSMSFALASAIGPFIGLFLVQRWDYQNIFALCWGFSLVAFLMALMLRSSDHLPCTPPESKDKFCLRSLIEPQAVPISIVVFLVALCYASILTYLNAYAIEIELIGAASFFFIVYSILVLFSRPFTGKLLDKQGPNIVMYPCFLSLALGLIVLANAEAEGTLLLAAGLIGLGFGNIQSVTQAIAIKTVNPGRIGVATSTYFIFFDTGMGVGPFILGFIIPYVDYRGLYTGMSGLAILSSLVYFIFTKGQRARR